MSRSVIDGEDIVQDALLKAFAARASFDGVSLNTPAYFVALKFAGDRVADIQDFLYAQYAMDGVEIRMIV